MTSWLQWYFFGPLHSSWRTSDFLQSLKGTFPETALFVSRNRVGWNLPLKPFQCFCLHNLCRNAMTWYYKPCDILDREQRSKLHRGSLGNKSSVGPGSCWLSSGDRSFLFFKIQDKPSDTKCCAIFLPAKLVCYDSLSTHRLKISFYDILIYITIFILV